MARRAKRAIAFVALLAMTASASIVGVLSLQTLVLQGGQRHILGTVMLTGARQEPRVLRLCWEAHPCRTLAVLPSLAFRCSPMSYLISYSITIYYLANWLYRM